MRMRGLIFLLVIPAIVTRSQDQSARTVPVLIELFTSEGCSSCPPVDSWLQQIDSSQPIPGVQAIVLSEHVDYWDHEGWKDPYSSSALTERQSIYARLFRLDSPYTPQLIMNGGTELHLNDPHQVQTAIEKSATETMIPVHIGPMDAASPGSPSLRVHIEIDGQSMTHNADVYAAIARDHAESQVLHGENGGRRLKHTAVVQELRKIGKLERQHNFNYDFDAKIPSGLEPRDMRLIVFVQEPGQGKILGAAMIRPGT
jgi:hypothetical protein